MASIRAGSGVLMTAVALLASLGTQRHDHQHKDVAPTYPLSSLQKDCRLERRLLPFGNLIGVWSRCADDLVLLVHPLNLLGHVSITSKSQALEFLRLFSSRDTYSHFWIFGEVEVEAGNERDRFVLEQLAFRQLCQPVKVDEYSMNGRKGYAVRRPVVLLGDRGLYELTEFVSEYGGYQVIGKRLLVADAQDLGIMELPPRTQ
jgi:hypothetical protein